MGLNRNTLEVLKYSQKIFTHTQMSLKDSSHLRVNKLEDMLTPPHGSCVARITVLSFADPKKEPSPQSLSVGQQQLPRSQRHLTCLEKSLGKDDMLSKHLRLQNLKVSCI